MTASRQPWIFIERLPNAARDGHRVFRREGRLAIADNSGPTPDATDDGVLWLDTEKPMHLVDDGGVRVWVPLRDRSGCSAVTVVCGRAARRLRELVPAWPVTFDRKMEDIAHLMGLEVRDSDGRPI